MESFGNVRYLLYDHKQNIVISKKHSGIFLHVYAILQFVTVKRVDQDFPEMLFQVTLVDLLFKYCDMINVGFKASSMGMQYTNHNQLSC